MDDENTNVIDTAGAAKTAPSGDDDVLAELQSELDGSEAETGLGDEQPESGQSEDDELEDYEHGGKAYKVPKALKPYLLREADYTRSKQALAEERKAVEAERKATAAEAEFRREMFADVSKLQRMDERLQALEALTPQQWAELEQRSPSQATNLTRELTLLKNQRDRLEGEIRQKQHHALETQRTEDAKRVEESLTRIAKKIPGWSDDLAGKLNDYATKNGFELEELQSFLPRKNADAYVSALHKAFLYDQLLAKTRAKAKPSVEPVSVPVQKVATRRSPASNEPLDSDPPDVWLRKRNKQLEAKGRW